MRSKCPLKFIDFTQNNNNNIRDTNFFIINFTNCWCGEWLLINEKVMLMVGLDEN